VSSHRCRECGSAHLRRSRRRNVIEALVLPLVLVRPFRCADCNTRQYGIGFHRLRRGISNAMLIAFLLGGVLVVLVWLGYILFSIVVR